MSFLKTTAIQHLNASGPAISFDIGGNVAIGTAAASGYRLHVEGKTKIGVNVPQGNPSSSDIASTAHTIMGGQGGNYLSIGQYANCAQWIQSSYANPSTAKYNMILQPLGGYVLTPNLPCFYVHNPTSRTGVGAITWNTIQTNNGNNFDGVTKFTAPTNGRYAFFIRLQVGFGGGYSWVSTRINGSQYGAISHTNMNGTTQWQDMINFSVFTLSAGDYVEAWTEVGPNNGFDGASMFTGYQIG